MGSFTEWFGYPSWLVYTTLLYLLLPLFAYKLLPFLYGNISTKKRIIVFVLGDLGHSPRICYHATSFATKGWDVDLCGYLEENPPIDLIENDNISIHSISIVKNEHNLPFIIFAVWKVFRQFFAIISLLWSLRGANYILIQNPPSIPILIISVGFKLVSRTKLIIDWHNLGYSILALKLGKEHIFVTLSKLYEKLLSKFADLNLTVTKEMKVFLKKEFGIQKDKIIVLYDKAASQFKPLNKEERLEVIKLHPDIFEGFKFGKDKILISSTSFTPDEDFNLLLDAFKLYDELPDTPKIRMIITGKGPLNNHF